MGRSSTEIPGHSNESGNSSGLVRTMGLWSLAIYGIGDMLGSGIYVLLNKAAGIMGNAIWLAFLASMVAALLTGLSYASIGSRYPRAGGAAYVTQRAFGSAFIAYVVGLAVMASGLTSMAAASRGFAGYFLELVGHLPVPLLVVAFILALTFVNFWGMRESVWLNMVCTAVEVGGLLLIVAVGMRYWGSVNYLEMPLAEGSGESSAARHALPIMVSLILQGAVLTFYSFIGFEDLLNVAEEVKDVRRTLPRALVLALIGVTLIYMAVSVTAVSVIPHAQLAASQSPLVDVVRRAASWFPPQLFTLISLFAITNTALLNYIMGSRLVYGMACQGLLPAALRRVHPRRHTPHIAILTLMVIVLVLGLSGDVSVLAKATSVLLLGVFITVNTALIVLKRRRDEPRGSFEVPTIVPLAGILVCALLLVHAQAREWLVAGVMLLLIVILYLVVRPKAVPLPDEAEQPQTPQT